MATPSPEFIHLLEQYTETTIAQEVWKKENSALNRTAEAHERSRESDRLKCESSKDQLYKAEDTIQRLTEQLATANDAIAKNEKSSDLWQAKVNNLEDCINRLSTELTKAHAHINAAGEE